MTQSSPSISSGTPIASKDRPRIQPPNLPDILTVDEAALLLRINRKTLYEVIRLEQPRWAVRFGRTIRVGRTALLEAFRGNGGPALGESS
jgi:excisionase family DNA binding protein